VVGRLIGGRMDETAHAFSEDAAEPGIRHQGLFLPRDGAARAASSRCGKSSRTEMSSGSGVALVSVATPAMDQAKQQGEVGDGERETVFLTWRWHFVFICATPQTA
jgi:hypothetical protein